MFLFTVPQQEEDLQEQPQEGLSAREKRLLCGGLMIVLVLDRYLFI
jgi:hypothetical protein